MVDDPLKNYKKTDTVGKLRMDVMYVMDACRRSTNNELASKDIMSDGVVNRSKETKVVTKKKRRRRRGIRTGADTWREPSTGPDALIHPAPPTPALAPAPPHGSARASAPPSSDRPRCPPPMDAPSRLR